jgi:hypothetical protein
MDEVSLETWKGQVPNPSYFDILQPGQTLPAGTRTEVLTVSPLAQRNSKVLAPGRYLLYLQLDFGTRNPQSNLSRQRWSEMGILLTGRIEVTALRLHVPVGEATETCSDRPH